MAATIAQTLQCILNMELDFWVTALLCIAAENTGLLTKEAKMEPPIHELNLRSTVVLFAISFRRML